MVPSTKDGGHTIKQMVLVDLYMQIKKCTVVIGRMIRHMAKVCSHMLMVLSTKDNGLMIKGMAKARRSGMTGLTLRDSLSKARKKVMGTSNGLMVLAIRVNSRTTTFTGKDSMNGLTADHSMEIGLITRWTV